jgi:hypothetical protein
MPPTASSPSWVSSLSFELESYRLTHASRDDLAQGVVWAAKDIGDGLGFDVFSFDEADETERMLKGMRTALGKFALAELCQLEPVLFRESFEDWLATELGSAFVSGLLAGKRIKSGVSASPFVDLHPVQGSQHASRPGSMPDASSSLGLLKGRH